jgi:hypothetical protein
MPTRILEIVRIGPEPSRLRLLETESIKPGPYAALNYCWGSQQHITTTNHTYPRYIKEIG